MFSIIVFQYYVYNIILVVGSQQNLKVINCCFMFISKIHDALNSYLDGRCPWRDQLDQIRIRIFESRTTSKHRCRSRSGRG